MNEKLLIRLKHVAQLHTQTLLSSKDACVDSDNGLFKSSIWEIWNASGKIQRKWKQVLYTILINKGRLLLVMCLIWIVTYDVMCYYVGKKVYVSWRCYNCLMLSAITVQAVYV
jgi:hypothetical protein